MQGNLFYDFGAPVPSRLRLSRIEEILRKLKPIDPIPCRQTLIDLCEDGTLDGVRTSFGWLVTEESFKKWVRRLNGEGA